MLIVRTAPLLLAATLLAACGGGDRQADPRPRATTGATGTTAAADAFPSRPQVDVDFAEKDGAEPPAFEREEGSGARDGDAYRLRAAGGGAVRAPARLTATPGTAAVLVLGAVLAPTELDGRTGVFCRGSADGRTGYELTVDRGGQVRLERVRDGRRTRLAEYDEPDAARQTDEPLPVALACGRDTNPASAIALGVTVGVNPMTFFDDPEPLDPGPVGRAGLLVREGGRASFAGFQLTVDRS